MSASDAVLAVRTPDGRTQPIPAQGRLVIGSDPGADGLRVEGPGVVPSHVALATIKGGGHGVVALDEGAITELDGRPVRKARIAAGARLKLGSLELELVGPGAAAGGAPAGSSAARPAASRKVNVDVTGFRASRLLGKGGMGLVYLAVQESLDREVALKLLRKQLCENADFVARFQAEARAAAKLAHPNVVTVYDVGEDKGQHYLALEYMQRGSLEDRLAAEGPLPWRAVLGILRDAAAGLEFAEQHGIVHRDIKPANLMQSAAGATKIVDLGLATAAEAEGDGKIRGTPHFMAPEQARGMAIDARTDLYALGATAYRLLSGKTPFEGETTKAILRAVIQEEPRPLNEHVDELPAEVASLVHRLMAKSPDDRPRSAGALRAQVEDLATRLAGPSASAGEGGGGGGKLGLILGGVGAVAAAAVAAVVMLGGGNDPEDIDRTGPTDEDPGNTALVDGGPPVPDEGSPPETVDGGDPPSTDGAEDAALRALEDRASSALAASETLADPAERAAALRELAVLYPGTTAATIALERAAELEAQATTPAVVEGPANDGPSPAETLVASARTLTRDATDTVLPPERAFAGLESFTLPPGYLPGEEYTQRFEAFRLELFAELRGIADARLAEADAALIAGDFDDAEQRYDSLLAWLTELPTGAAPPSTGEVVGPAGQPAGAEDGQDEPATEEPGADGLPQDAEALLAELQSSPAEPEWKLGARVTLVRDRLRVIPSLTETHALAMRQGDRSLVAESVQGGALERSVRSMDMAGASAALRALLPKLRSPEYSAPLAILADELDGSTAAFDLLASAWRDGEWRRRSVALPGGSRSVAEVRTVVEEGLMLEPSADAPASIDWADYAGDSGALDQLFESRLERDYTSPELAAIATLVRAAAVTEVLDLVEPILDPDQQARLSQSEARQLDEAVERAVDWASRSGTSDGAAGEQRASMLLRTALRAMDESDWTSATYAFERLLREEPTSLLVMTLSDGRPLEAPAVWPPDLPAPPPTSSE